MPFNSRQIGTYTPPPSTGQVAANLAGNSAASGNFSLIGGPQGYAGVGIPVYNNGNISTSVGAFSTFGPNMKRSNGVGAGIRFNF